MPGAISGTVPLNDKEKAEFDHVSVDSINALTDVSKLARLEAYMRYGLERQSDAVVCWLRDVRITRSEGFPSTADAARTRLDALNAGKNLPHDPEARARLEREAADSMQDLLNWTKHVSDRDTRLKHAAAAGATSTNAADGLPALRSGIKIAVNEAPAPRAQTPAEAPPKAKADSKFGGQVRSGAEYYKKWDEFAERETQALDADNAGAPPSEQPAAKRNTTAAHGFESGPCNTSRILRAAAQQTQVEREIQAEREKEKGNEFFRAREYTQAVEAYTVALELHPASAAVRANRAAAYLKLAMWQDAELDCSEVLAGNSSHAKALMRRARARLELGKHADALLDADAALLLFPDDKDLTSIRSKARTALQKGSMTRVTIEEDDGDDAPDAAPAPAAASADSVDFMPAAQFAGARPGYVFQNGASGLGYYRDAARAAAPAGSSGQARAALPAAAQSESVEQPAHPPRQRIPIAVVDNSDSESECGADETVDTGAEKNQLQNEVPVTNAEASASSVPDNATANSKAAPSEESARATAATRRSAEALQSPDEVAEACKAAGNAAFGTGELPEAVRCFTRAIDACPDLPVPYSNRAAALLQQRAYTHVVRDTTTALGLGPAQGVRIKALNRRAKARASLGDLAGAKADLQTAYQEAATSAEKATIKAEMTAVVTKLVAEERADKAAAAERRSQRAARNKPTHYKGGVIIEELSDDEDEESAPSAAAQEVVAAISAGEAAVSQARQRAEQLRREFDAKQQAAADPPSATPAAVADPKQQAASAVVGTKMEKDQSTSTAKSKIVALVDGTSARCEPVRAVASSSAAEHESARQRDGSGGGAAPDAALADSVAVLKARGGEAFARQDFAAAAARYSEALEMKPDAWDCLSNRAMAHLAAGHAQACLHDTEALIERCGDRVIVRKAMHRRGKALHQLQRLEEALDVLEALRQEMTVERERNIVKDDIGLILKDMDKRREAAAPPPAGKRAAASPAVSRRTTQGGESDASDASYVLVSDSGAEADRMPNRSEPAAAPTPAAEATRHPSTAQSASADEFRQRGNELWKAGKADEALAAYDRALEQTPGDSRLHANRAHVLLHLRRFDAALAAADAAVDASRGADAARRAKAHHRRAAAHAALGHAADAVADYERVCALEPSVQAKRNLDAARTDLAKQARGLRPADAGPSGDDAERAESRTAGESDSAPAAASTMRTKVTVEEVSDEELEAEGFVRVGADEANPAGEGAGCSGEGGRSAKGPGAAEVRKRAKELALGAADPASSERCAAETGGEDVLQPQSVAEGGAVRSQNQSGKAGVKAPYVHVSRALDVTAQLSGDDPVQMHMAAAEVAEAAIAKAKEGIVAAKHPVPKTASEFTRVTNALRKDSAALSAYVTKIPPASFSAIFKSNIDMAIIDTLTAVLADESEARPDWSRSCLMALLQVDRFALCVRLCRKATLQKLKAVVETLQSGGADMSAFYKAVKLA